MHSKQPVGFGRWLRDFRRDKSLTQSQLARELRSDQTTVSAVELGQKPSLDFLYALSQAFGIDETVLRAQAGMTEERGAVNELARAELLSVFDTMTDDDQLRLIEMAKGMKRAETKLKQAQPKRRLKPG